MPEIAKKMFKNARCEEEREEIRWCINQDDSGEKTFLEAVEWCGLDTQYRNAYKKLI